MPTHLDRVDFERIISSENLGENSATPYFEFFCTALKDYIAKNLEPFSHYLHAIRQFLPRINPEEPQLDSICESAVQTDFHHELLIRFYSRVYKRILFKIKKKNIDKAAYFANQPAEGWKNFLHEAVQEETEHSNTISSAIQSLKPLSDDEIRDYKFNHLLINVNSYTLGFKITETILGAGTKINSTTKRIDTTHFFPQVANTQPFHPLPPNMADLHTPHLTDLLQPQSSSYKPYGINPTSFGFQIAGIIFSGLWLIYNIIYIAYHKKKENRDIFTKDNLREALPSFIFFPLSLVALLTPVGMWIAIVFAAHSIIDVAYKLYEHFKNRNQVKKDIKANNDNIIEIERKRHKYETHISNALEKLKSLDLTKEAEQATELIKTIQEYTAKNAAARTALCDALNLKDKLEIDLINKTNNYAVFSYTARTVIAVAAAVGLALTFIPPTMFIGGMILLVTTCLSAAIFIPQIINRFRSHNKITQMRMNKLEEYGVDTKAMLKGLKVSTDKVAAQPATKAETANSTVFAMEPRKDEALGNKLNDEEEHLLERGRGYVM